MSTPAPIAIGDIYHDGRRWLRVEASYSDGKHMCRVIGKKVGDRIINPGNETTMRGDALRLMTRVQAAPEPTGPDHGVIAIDQQDQSITIDGVRLFYHVGSSGPRIKNAADTKDGAHHVTVTFTAKTVRCRT